MQSKNPTFLGLIRDCVILEGHSSLWQYSTGSGQLVNFSLFFFLIWCLDKLGLNREQAGALLTSKNESYEGHLDLSYGYRVVHLWPFGICSGLHDPSCRILPPVSVEFLSPHFLLLIILFIVSHL